MCGVLGLLVLAPQAVGANQATYARRVHAEINTAWSHVESYREYLRFSSGSFLTITHVAKQGTMTVTVFKSPTGSSTVFDVDGFIYMKIQTQPWTKTPLPKNLNRPVSNADFRTILPRSTSPGFIVTKEVSRKPYQPILSYIAFPETSLCYYNPKTFFIVRCVTRDRNAVIRSVATFVRVNDPRLRVDLPPDALHAKLLHRIASK
jgi:hypothetical protein